MLQNYSIIKVGNRNNILVEEVKEDNVTIKQTRGGDITHLPAGEFGEFIMDDHKPSCEAKLSMLENQSIT